MSRFRDKMFLRRIFEWVNSVLDIVENIPNNVIGRNISYQLSKSCTSFGANLEEADSAYSTKEFTSFVNISKRELKESVYWMKILKFRKIVDIEKNIEIESEELIKVLFSIVKNTQVKTKLKNRKLQDER